VLEALGHQSVKAGLKVAWFTLEDLGVLLHHAHVCQTTGESVRLTQALAGRGVSRLS